MKLAARVSIPVFVVAVLLACSTLAASVLTVSTPWDVWYYHLPFAARLAAIVPERAYLFHATNQARYDGFPLLGELLQGLLWKISGRPESANLVAFGSLAAFVSYLYRSHRVPPYLAFVALFAVPLVQLHAAGCYVDLPANLALAALLLETIGLYATARRPGPWWFLALAGVAINMRFQLHVATLLTLLAAAPRVLGPMVSEVRHGDRVRAMSRLTGVVAALPFVFFTPLKNLVLHHNPYFPMRLAIFGRVLPGVEDTYSSSPVNLTGSPRFVRFLYSLLELHIRPFSDEHRWTPDQWAPWDSPALRMGGFFGAYVVFAVGLLLWMALRRTPKEARIYAGGFAVVTAVTSLLPQSHELRYYMFWMITLIAMNLVLVARTEGRALSSVAAIGSLAALAVVVASTRAGYVAPWGPSFRQLTDAKVGAPFVESLRDGDRVCLSRDPWTFLYAPTFHPVKTYAVRETEHPEDCGDYRWVP